MSNNVQMHLFQNLVVTAIMLFNICLLCNVHVVGQGLEVIHEEYITDAGAGDQSAFGEQRWIYFAPPEVDEHYRAALNQIISVNLSNVLAEDALKQIADLGGLRLSYSIDVSLTDWDDTISLNLERATVLGALYEVLRDTNLRLKITSRGLLILHKGDDAIEVDLSDDESDVWQRSIHGVVTDTETGVSLPGVNVIIEGTNIGTVTDNLGEYVLNVPDSEAVLLFSYIGYQRERVVVEDQAEINIRLAQDVSMLDQMVVIGYSAMKKSSLTSAISKVENVNLDQMPAVRPETALVGRMAGVSITHTRTRPGASPTITIRGPGSIDAGNDPLIVIDGFPGGSFDNINMNDVESIEVLKDASSSAIYGSRGAGGVIIVTTKQGRPGSAQFSYNGYYGVSYPILYNDWVSPGQEFYEYQVRYINRDFARAGGDTSLPLWGDERRPANFRVNPVIAEGDYIWEDILYNPAPIQNHNLSVAGGTDDLTYYISGTFTDEQGTLMTTKYRKYSVRANIDVDISPVFDAGIMVNPNYFADRNYPGSTRNYIKAPHFLPPDAQNDGTYLRPRDFWGTNVSGMVNPIATFEGTYLYDNTFNNVGELYLGANIMEGLYFRSSFGSNINFMTRDRFQKSTATSNLRTSGEGRNVTNINWINENVLTYQTNLGGVHDFISILGASYQKNDSRDARIIAVNNSFANETIHTLNNAQADPSSRTTKTHWGLASFFSRVNYAYDDKYLLSASVRTDGSSRFGPDNRWGVFPSGSIGWRISQEEFMQEISFINELKVRASYGVVGNFNIGNFQYLATINDYNYAPGEQLVAGQAESAFGNSALKWERTESYDIGLELSLLENRLNFVLDFYNKLTKDLLYNVTIPSIAGFTNTITNVGNVRNRGVELEINLRNYSGSSFSWNTSLNFTRNKNEVTSLGGVDEVISTGSGGAAWILRVGEPMFSYFGYQMDGVIMSEAELNDGPVMPGQPAGTPRFRDVNGDGVITPADRVILGNFMPDFFMGMTNDLRVRDFDLSFTIQSSIGNMTYAGENRYMTGATVSAMRRPLVENEWWSEDEPGDGQTPSTALSNLSYIGPSDNWVQDASFVALRNVNLGYTLPASVVENLRLSSLRVYLSIRNALMFTSSDFTGLNPEGATQGGISGIGSTPGFDRGTEPMNRVVSFGFNLNF